MMMVSIQLMPVIRGYVMRAAPLLVAANDDMTSPAAEQLQVLCRHVDVWLSMSIKDNLISLCLSCS